MKKMPRAIYILMWMSDSVPDPDNEVPSYFGASGRKGKHLSRSRRIVDSGSSI